MRKVTASVVLFNTPHFLISRIISCVVNSNACDKLFIIDNSPDPIKFNFKIYKIVEYIRSENNGYGAGHNLALKRVANFSDFHFDFGFIIGKLYQSGDCIGYKTR